MSMNNPMGQAGRGGAAARMGNPMRLEYPQSLAVYDEYVAAQKAVDFLSDEGFPVQNCLIVGTDLKRIERITGRLTYGRAALGGALSGLYFGFFVGLLISLFDSGNNSALATIIGTMILGVIFGAVFAVASFAATRGQRDFQSITQVVATRYEVLVEHKVATQAREVLARLPGATPDPFA